MSNRVIWKYPLTLTGTRFALTGTRYVEMPKGARILSVANQHDCVRLWALCDPEAPKVRHFFDIIPTGVTIGGDALGPLVGVVLLVNGNHVVHVFDDGEET